MVVVKNHRRWWNNDRQKKSVSFLSGDERSVLSVLTPSVKTWTSGGRNLICRTTKEVEFGVNTAFEKNYREDLDYRVYKQLFINSSKIKDWIKFL